MKNKEKIIIINVLTVISAFLVLFCLSTLQGISFNSLLSLACSVLFADVTMSLYKIENILRKKENKFKIKNEEIVVYKNKRHFCDVA